MSIGAGTGALRGIIIPPETLWKLVLTYLSAPNGVLSGVEGCHVCLTFFL